MKTIKEFLGRWCDPGPTDVQRAVTEAMLKQGRVIGVARAVGGIEYMPLVSFGVMQPNVIDRAGYYQLASRDGMRIFTPHNCVPWRGRFGELGECVHCGAKIDAITAYYSDRANSCHAAKAP